MAAVGLCTYYWLHRLVLLRRELCISSGVMSSGVISSYVVSSVSHRMVSCQGVSR